MAGRVVARVYTPLGGRRAAAWTNVVQGAIFLGFMIAAFFVFADDLHFLHVVVLQDAV